MADAATVYERNGTSAIAGYQLRQNLYAYPLWNLFLLRQRPAQVIELGTGTGDFTCLLGYTCQAIGARFTTFDHAAPRRLSELEALGVDFRLGDILGGACDAEIIAAMQQPGPTLLLCDNGNKPVEVQRFAPYCKHGDVLAAHDYHHSEKTKRFWPWGEIFPADVASLAADFDPFEQESFQQAAWMVMRRRRGTPAVRVV